MPDAKLFANRSALFANDAESAMIACSLLLDQRGCTPGQLRIATPMAASLKLLPGSTVRWRCRRYLIVDYESLDAIIARQPGKRRLERTRSAIEHLYDLPPDS
jgi:hypothetical protein